MNPALPKQNIYIWKELECWGKIMVYLEKYYKKGRAG
jgi:hypothetical protein